MAYVDLATIQATDPGDILTAAWCDQVRDNDEFLINPPAVSAFNSANQSVANATLTVLNADSENFDNDSMHSLVTNNSRITIQTPGRYLFLAAVSFAISAGAATVSFLENGATTHNGVLLPNAGGTTRVLAIRLLTLSASDYIEVRVSQSSGGSANVALIEFGATFLTE